MAESEQESAILIVDDNPANLRVLAQLLTEQGYRARPVPSGLHALFSVQTALPDLILLDIRMPDMDGYEVCRRLKASPESQEIPVIFISALDETFDKVKAFEAGGVDYVTKPFQPEEVLARVQTHLALRRLQRELAQKNESLTESNATLEEQVARRTQALQEANRQLQGEIAQRVQQQAEKDRLFDLARQQGEQLRLMTQGLLEAQQQQRSGLSSGLDVQLQQKIARIRSYMSTLRTLLPQMSAPHLLQYITDTEEVLAEMTAYLGQVTTDLDRSSQAEIAMAQELLLQLSTRERQVLRLLADGKSTADIAALLTLTHSSVQTYIKRMRKKLDMPDLASLVAFARAQF